MQSSISGHVGASIAANPLEESKFASEHDYDDFDNKLDHTQELLNKSIDVGLPIDGDKSEDIENITNEGDNNPDNENKSDNTENKLDYSQNKLEEVDDKPEIVENKTEDEENKSNDLKQKSDNDIPEDIEKKLEDGSNKPEDAEHNHEHFYIINNSIIDESEKDKPVNSQVAKTHRTLEKHSNPTLPIPNKKSCSQKDLNKTDLVYISNSHDDVQEVQLKQSPNMTYDMQDELIKLDKDSSFESKLIKKYDDQTTPETFEDRILANQTLEMTSYKGDNINDIAYDKTFESDEWKQTPLFVISQRCEFDHEIINTLLDTKSIDMDSLGLQVFKNQEILEFENEVNIILTSLKRKVKIETMIIQGSMSDSRDLSSNGAIPSRNEEKNTMHTFLHASRYVTILENTLRYLLHCIG